MKKFYRSLLVITAVLLLANCVNVEMETAVNEDRSGKGRLIYSYDPAQNVEQIDIDETFATIERNPTVKVTGSREYDSEGTHYREIAWIFEDINKVDLEGLTYSYTMEEGKPVLRAIFEKISEEEVEETDVGPAPAGTPDSFEEAAIAGTNKQSSAPSPEPSLTGKAGTNVEIPSSENSAVPAGSLANEQGLSLQEQMEIDAETQRKMEEMFNVMIMTALEGFSVKFRFILPREVHEAPGAVIDGETATWEIPLKNLVDPSVVTPFDEFKIVMKPE